MGRYLCEAWQGVRFVAKDGKKYDLCQQFVLDCQRWKEVRFVASNLCLIVKDGKKYDLLPAVCP